VQIEKQAPKKIQERREKIERDIAAFKAKGGKVQSLDKLRTAAEGIGITPWHELPAHIKITYQSQARYERLLEVQGKVELEVKTD